MKISILAICLLLVSSAKAIWPNQNYPGVSSAEDGRLCVLKLSGSGNVDRLSGFLWNNQFIVSVGHSNSLHGFIQAKCGSRTRLVQNVRSGLRHPRYDFIDQPQSTEDWAKYDIAIFPLAKSLERNLAPLPVLSDASEIQSLIVKGKCTVSGSGGLSGDFQNLRIPTILTPPVSSRITSPEHIVLEYPGKPVIFHGDSGGPLLCEKGGISFLAGLLEYGGLARNAMGESSNVLGILVLREELVKWLYSN